MNTTEHYLNDIRSTTLEYRNKWMTLADTMGKAYSNAYNHQQTVLNAIKKSIEEARKREEAMMSFALGLLTGGIVGPIADRLAKSVGAFTNGSTLEQIAGQVTKDSLLTEWTGNAIKVVATAGEEWGKGKIMDLGSPGSPASPQQPRGFLDWQKDAQPIILLQNAPPPPAPETTPFEPTGMSASDYTQTLRLGIGRRADAMSDIARTFHRELTAIPPKAAEAINKSFLSSSFFTSLPTKELDETQLQRSAELMLWVGWGRVRDEPYWRKEHSRYLNMGTHEQAEHWHWVPLLKELSQFGVPDSAIALPAQKHKWMNRVEQTKVFNMLGFMTWSRSAAAASLAFRNHPTDAVGISAVHKRIVMQ